MEVPTKERPVPQNRPKRQLPRLFQVSHFDPTRNPPETNFPPRNGFRPDPTIEEFIKKLIKEQLKYELENM
ncbi:hypothetical protein HMI56_004538 [Coelomomyces lativittatus]|nr:hypothetical protein HMI56_004538 [Coelomomyces lativittatus]